MMRLAIKHDFNTTAVLIKVDFVCHLFNEKYSAPSIIKQVLTIYRVSYLIRIKTFSLILHFNNDLVLFNLQYNVNGFLSIQLVSVFNRICNGLC